ncbi:8-oxo-dGTP diphosphatase [Streptosporangium becharense]|uniref:8-oxo-dGTP diphosphatase n=1 Tax=Streptosporangium becharense TaxID=1816182 RepID=A0A7W9MI16_9ACTN|nr:NUDIX hydrolase [Streptosporangium becharense]MBB2913348.1 8-oxo-dGTP diphosphatase [Streptosporangium becharense]MBB5821038.1 8-oxo-dGTP diphosphatase [Streptosporangium becharense]
MTEPDAFPAGLIRAAGAVVWRGPETAPEVVLVHRPKYDDWSFPKGKLKPGEHVVAAALREVAEETGVTVELGRPLPTSRYTKGGRPKRVDYWLARMVADEHLADGNEVDRVAWLPVAEARRRLTYEADRGLLSAFDEAPPATTPLVLVRHGLAGDRHEWDGPDDERPLDETGRRQAGVLADVLDAFRPAELVSSPSRRCVQTLEPYAGRAGLGVRLEPPLSETRYDPRACLRLVSEALASDRSTVLCSHGKVLPDLISRIDDRPGDTHLGKGAFMVMHHRDGRVVGVERHLT